MARDYKKQYRKPQNMTFLEYLNDASLFGTPIVILKLETTGLDENEDEICAIRALKCKFERISDVYKLVSSEFYKTLIKIRQNVPEEVTNITGITTKMLKEHGIDKNEALSHLNQMTEGAYICGFNTKNFLYPFLFKALKEQNLKPAAIGGFDIRDLVMCTVLPKHNRYDGYSAKELKDVFHQSQESMDSLEGYAFMISFAYHSLPKGAKIVSDGFVTNSYTETRSGVKHIIFETELGDISLNCYNLFFTEETIGIFDTIDMNSFCDYILKKTKCNSLEAAIKKLS